MFLAGNRKNSTAARRTPVARAERTRTRHSIASQTRGNRDILYDRVIRFRAGCTASAVADSGLAVLSPYPPPHEAPGRPARRLRCRLEQSVDSRSLLPPLVPLRRRHPALERVELELCQRGHEALALRAVRRLELALALAPRAQQRDLRLRRLRPGLLT